jgi:hypothetical protein
MTATTPLWLWGVGLTIGFPLLAIVLGEVIHRLRRRGLAVANSVSLVRDVLLPMLVLLLFLEHLLGLDPATRLFQDRGDDLLGLRDPCGPVPAERGAV